MKPPVLHYLSWRILTVPILLASGYAQTPSPTTSASPRAPDVIVASILEAEPNGWIDLLASVPLEKWIRAPLPPSKPLSSRNPWSYDANTGVLTCAASGIHEMLLFPAAIYNHFPPRVNASRPPGNWQSYDIYYVAPRFSDGKKISSAKFTILHNDLPVHLNVELPGDQIACNIRIRPHGSPVRFRNIWVRPLHEYDENAGKPLPPGARTTNPFKRK